MLNRVIISIGSNIDAHTHIDAAINLLAKHMQVEKMAPRLVTAPIGGIPQPDFVNTAVSGTTYESFNELNKNLKQIENQMGRDRSRPKFGPREIDLDILEWNDKIVDDDFTERDFLQKIYIHLKNK